MNSKVSSLGVQLETTINCGQVVSCVRTHEPDEVINIIDIMTSVLPMKVAIWDCVDGLLREDRKTPYVFPMEEEAAPVASDNPMAALGHDGGQNNKTLKTVLAKIRNWARLREKLIETALQTGKMTNELEQNLIYVIKQSDREIGINGNVNKELLMLIQLISAYKQSGCHVVLLCPAGTELPVELQNAVWTIDHDLPSVLERRSYVDVFCESNNLTSYSPEELGVIADVTSGLTISQIDGVLARSLQKYNLLSPTYISALKTSIINSGGLLTLYKGQERFESQTISVGDETQHIPGLGGLQGIKSFCTNLIRNSGTKKLAKPKGVLIVGVPGSGKSAFAKALGNEVGRPTIQLDIGRLMGSLVGATEASTRAALQKIDAMAPCLVYVDEIEKSLGSAGGEHDGGVNKRLVGTILTWMNDHTSDVFFIATANDVTKLPPEFTRAERFDAMLFMDVPTPEQRKVIWDIYLDAYGISRDQPWPNDRAWTGAEIKSCCTKAYLLDLPLVEAAKLVIPIALGPYRESVKRLREWAVSNCIDAETGTKYVLTPLAQQQTEVPDEAPPKRAKRKITRTS